MTKIIATLLAAFALMFGGLAVIAPAASAEDCVGVTCEPPAEPCLGVDCPAPPQPEAPCRGVDCPPPSCEVDRAPLLDRLHNAEQTANAYHLQIIAVTAQLERQDRRLARQQRVLDRRAATIRRLRAKLAHRR